MLFALPNYMNPKDVQLDPDEERGHLQPAAIGLNVPLAKQESAAVPASSKAAEGPTKEHLELYCVFRDYLKHEDNLINNRLNWNFTIQGFLFFSWAYCFQKAVDLEIALAAKDLAAESAAKLTSALREIHAAMMAIGCAGFIVTLLVFFAALGAELAINNICGKWNKDHPEYAHGPELSGDARSVRKLVALFRSIRHGKLDAKHDTHEPHLPGIIGGGRRGAHVLGFGAPIAIPIFFMAAWVLLTILLTIHKWS